MGGFLGWLFAAIMRRPLARFHRDLREPRAAQERALRAILLRNAKSRFGRENRFAALAGRTGAGLWREYRSSLPIRNPTAFAPWIEDMKAGAPDLLTPGRPIMFSLTSGTSATPKFCPVTPAFIGEHHRQHLLWLFHCFRDHPSINGGSYLFTAGPAEAGRTSGGIPFGSMSGRQLADQSIPVRRRMAVPARVFALPDPLERFRSLLLFALARRDLTVASAVNPSTLIRLADSLAGDAGELLDGLERMRRTGGGRDGFPARRFRPEPGRIRTLREIFQAEGRLTPRSVWPELRLILTWQGGSAAMYLPRLRELWGNAPQRCLGLRASEGTFSIPLRDGDPAGVLAVGGHVMEFLPASDREPEADARTLLADELEAGGRYRLVITTSGGFYRYDLGDQIRVAGFRDRTPEIVFERRSGAFLSATGEKVTEEQAVAALRAAAAGPAPNGFTLTWELREGRAGYVLALEYPDGEGELGRDGEGLRRRLRGLAGDFDAELRRRNCEYDAKRGDGRLAAPRCLLLANRSHEKWRERLVRAGRFDAQVKLPVLVPPPGEGKAPLPNCPVFGNLTLAAEI